jgi:endonuclease-8
MPEGDTLHRTAERLRPALAGKRLAAFTAPRLRGDRPRTGVVIEAVQARGKNLLIDFEGGLTLRTHLRMTGSWHLYRTSERWRQPRHLARAIIETDDGWCAVCFAAPVVETFHRQAPLPPPLARLGPDLCDPEVDLDAILTRFAALADPDAEIGSLLLDQRIAAGVGNVYKSEACFACGIDPFTPAHRIPDHARRRLFATASRLLRANLGAGPRKTIDPPVSGSGPGANSAPGPGAGFGRSRGAESGPGPGAESGPGGGVDSGSGPGAEPGPGRRPDAGAPPRSAPRPGFAPGPGPRAGLAVYRRRGQACRRCGTPVRARRQGPEARTTYWCPCCQTMPIG